MSIESNEIKITEMKQVVCICMCLCLRDTLIKMVNLSEQMVTSTIRYFNNCKAKLIF
jgi:hypothetical protein